MKLGRLLSLFLALLLLLFAGCSEAQDTRYPLTEGGIDFAAPPLRVVSLSPSTTETLIVLGYGGRLVGISDECEGLTAPGRTLCGNLLEPQLDSLLALSPDLVVAAAQPTADHRARLAAAGVPVLVLPRAQSLEALYENCRLLCTVFSGAALAERRVAELKSFVEAELQYLWEGLTPLGDAKRAIYLAQTDFTMATPDTLEGELLHRLGLENHAAAYTRWSYPAEMEPDLNPELILYADSIPPAYFTSSDYYRRTFAVRDERLIPINAAALERQSPALFLALENSLTAAFPAAYAGIVKADYRLPAPVPEEPAWYEFWK